MKTITPNMSQMRMLASIRAQQWMIRPDAVHDYALSALEASEKADSGGLEMLYDMRKPMSLDSDGIATVEIRGALLQKCPALYEMLGIATRYGTISAEVEAAQTAGAAGIIYVVDSPGGTVSGVIEGGASIVGAGVPSVAFCSGLACSAAYWLASGASAIVATPSATVGNIGAIVSWADCDAFWAEIGVTFKALVSEGADLKSTFHLEPDEAQLAFLQESIDEAGAAFRDHVQKGRSAAGATLDPEVFRAGWYSGERAGSLGLIDSIGSLSEARDALKSLIGGTD